LRDASYATKKILLELNNTSNPIEINSCLSQITDMAVDESVAVFTPFHINYGKNTKIGENVFINFDCTFLDLGDLIIATSKCLCNRIKEGMPNTDSPSYI
jgi:acetyltransferase-like isoleucine patch superfamily enzyme